MPASETWPLLICDEREILFQRTYRQHKLLAFCCRLTFNARVFTECVFILNIEHFLILQCPEMKLNKFRLLLSFKRNVKLFLVPMYISSTQVAKYHLTPKYSLKCVYTLKT